MLSSDFAFVIQGVRHAWRADAVEHRPVVGPAPVAVVLGGRRHSGMSVATLLLGILPHAIPELMALFLPLAAWIVASRRGAWHELLAATVVTTALAVPVLIASALIEVFVSPNLLLALRG